MVPELRRAFNSRFTEEKYQEKVRRLEAEAGHPIGFRICETPLFLSAAVTGELVEAVEEIVDTVISPAYLKESERAVPPGLSVPGEDAHTAFLQVDFALVQGEDGGIHPQLIELQGFPSVYSFQWLLDRVTRQVDRIDDLVGMDDIPAGLTPYFNGLDDAGYADCLREMIVGDCDPENVVLLEIDPSGQKTRVDFSVTERLFGVRSVDVRDVIERQGRLFYQREGEGGKSRREVPIHRIYNRVIFDEMERRGVSLDPVFRRELDVHWVGHPNWFLKISKFTLPFLRGRYVPRSYFVSDLNELPQDLENYVLKPLYSFAGLGVEIGVTAERLRSIDQPEHYILQRRVEYAPLIETPDGGAKAEIRMMLVWEEGKRPILINNLVRVSKGLMSGVDFNKDKTWIGASLGYHPTV
jgi:hypothetical protein